MSKISIPVVVDSKRLVESLVDSMNREALYRLIIDIDAVMSDWDFTLRLAKHFAAERMKYEQEVVEDAK